MCFTAGSSTIRHSRRQTIWPRTWARPLSKLFPPRVLPEFVPLSLACLLVLVPFESHADDLILPTIHICHDSLKFSPQTIRTRSKLKLISNRDTTYLFEVNYEFINYDHDKVQNFLDLFFFEFRVNVESVNDSMPKLNKMIKLTL